MCFLSKEGYLSVLNPRCCIIILRISSHNLQFMHILKFIRSFNTTGTYLFLATFLLILLIIYFYIVEPA